MQILLGLTVRPVSARAGGGVLFATVGGAYHWKCGGGRQGEEGGEAAGGRHGTVDSDGTGWITPVPHCSPGACTSLSWAPGSMTIAVAVRGQGQGQGQGPGSAVRGGAGAGGVTTEAGAIDTTAARNVVMRANLNRSQSQTPNDNEHLSSSSGRWERGAVATGHENAAVMSRAALLRPDAPHVRPTFLAGGDEHGGRCCVAVWRAQDGSMVQRLPPHNGGIVRPDGAGCVPVLDVRGWCGAGGGGAGGGGRGGGEVLASVSRDWLQLCAWQPS